MSDFSNNFFVYSKPDKQTSNIMFLNTRSLNEGGCTDKCSESKKRELLEGENPKSTSASWHEARSSSLVNSNWQKLRK